MYSFLAETAIKPVAQRVFDLSFAYFDIAFLVVFVALLIWQKKYMTLLVGFLAGILYTIVDFGVFYAAYGERVIKLMIDGVWVEQEAGMVFLILFWMSMSYGFTNFTWIWLWVSKDKRLFEWTLLILFWWLCGPMLATQFTTGTLIQTYRVTNKTHGGMAIMFLIGYIGAIMWNLKHRDKEHSIPIPWILSIGILVQFGWEAGLLLGGIRNAEGIPANQQLMTLIVNSLLETNLGMPYLYMLFIMYSAKYTEKMKKRQHPLTCLERMAELNGEKVRGEVVGEFLA